MLKRYLKAAVYGELDSLLDCYWARYQRILRWLFRTVDGKKLFMKERGMQKTRYRKQNSIV
jgi:hypothetical protein